MKKFIVIFSLLALLFVPAWVYSQSAEEQLHQKEEEIEELENKINDLQNQAKTLSDQITVVNSQIQIALLKISQTEQEIQVLNTKIQRLEVSLDHFSQVLENRISHTYREAKVDPLSLLFSSTDLPSFLSKYKYMRVIQTHDRKLVNQLAQTQASYEDQRLEEEQLKTKLESQKQQLAQQIKQKEYLLEVTKNDEKKFQSLLAAAKAEQQAIRAAMSTLNLKDGSPVNKGDTIALIGNTGAPGCSTGAHLHFEVVKDDVHQNPANYLKSMSVNWDNQPDGQFPLSGDWDWPIENPRITQGFGMTFWASRGAYGGGPHTGIDMVSENISIKAPKSGTLYKGSATCRGSNMNYVAIDHGGGIFTWYWHVR